MTKYLPINKVIEEAKKSGINFGKTDPYNRLRYYTKMGWLPNMTRRLDPETNEVKGHYPEWVLNILSKIEYLRKQSTSKEEITKLLDKESQNRSLKQLVYNNNSIKNVLKYVIILFLSVIIIIQLQTQNNTNRRIIEYINEANTFPFTNQVLDYGTSLITADNFETLVNTQEVENSDDIVVTFKQDISPATKFWVEKLEEENGFKVKINAPAAKNLEFTWAILQ